MRDTLFVVLQAVVDNMSLAGCSNLNAWVRSLDKRVEAVLAMRLEKVNQRVQVAMKNFGPGR